MKLTDEFGVIFVGILVLLSLIFVSYPLLIKKSGVIIASISDDSSCRDVLLPGSVITSIDDNIIQNSNDFYSVIEGLKGRIGLIVNGGPRICTIEEDRKINAKVNEFENDRIKFGTDIVGGIELVIKSGDADTDFSVIESRISGYGFDNIKTEKRSSSTFGILFDSSDENLINDMLIPGIVSGKTAKVVELKNNTGKFLLNDRSYDIEGYDEFVRIENKTYSIGDVFSLDDLEIEVQNTTGNFTSFYIKIFDDKDIDISNSQNKRSFQNLNRYVFVVDATLSKGAGENFAKATKGQSIVVNPQGENYLQDPLIIFVDDETITSFPISSSEAGVEITLINLWGVENTKEDADKKLNMLTTFLESGRLSDIEITERWETKPEKDWVLELTTYTIIGIIGFSFLYSLIRHKNIKMAGLVLGVFITEVILLLGSVSSQIFTMFLLISCTIFATTKNKKNDWIKWSSVILMFIIMFGAVANKLIIDSYTLFGLMGGFLVNGIYLILSFGAVKSNKKYEKINNLIWKINLVILAGLLVLFFFGDLKNLAVAATIIMTVNLALTKPEYNRFVNKWK